MRKRAQRSATITLLATLVASLIGVVNPGVAQAAMPELQWSPVTTKPNGPVAVTSPNGNSTVPCWYGNTPLRTYSPSGQVVQEVPLADIDGVQNCIAYPVVDKNGGVYGVPSGGPNLLAYSGNTLKWRYPIACNSRGLASYVVGATGNVYATTRLGNGDVRLVGLTPDVASGQTQPAKVLDVDIPNDCSIELFAYKDGLMLRGQSSGFRFYNYSGKLLTTLSSSAVGSFWHSRLNADGALFDYQQISGTYNAQTVKKHDPRTGGVAWTTQVSTPGANSHNPVLYPTPGGGVIAIFQEQKMVGGVPSTPEELVFTLVILNSAGTKIRSLVLPNTGANGVRFVGPPYASVDAAGRVAVLRGTSTPYVDHWGTTRFMHGVAIGVYDSVTDAWPYEFHMTGDTQQSGGPSSYGSFDGPVLGSNTLLIRALCTNNCADSEWRLYPVKVTGIGMDYPRGEVLNANTPAQPAPISYVNMGDSYSSGQGAGTYDAGTVTSTNKCYKSLAAYGRVAHRDPSSPLSLTTFAACGGSVTDNIDQNGTYQGVSKQNTALSSSTQAVTITIGGNDIGFVDVIKTCANFTQDCDAAFNLATSNLGILAVKLQRVYLDILNKAPNAEVYVLGYPPIVATGPGCFVGNNGSDFPFFNEDRKQKAVTLQASLNTTIQNNVNTVRSINSGYSQRLKFIDATAPGSPFVGHDVCSAEPYVNGLFMVGDSSESFHPNVKGQKAYAELLAANLN